MHRRIRIAALAAALAAAPAAQAANEWSITPYLWGAGFDGTIGVAGGDSGLGDRVQFDFGSLSSNMRLAGFMLNGSWRNDRWTAFGDWTWAEVKSDAPTARPNLISSIDAEINGNIVQANFGYDLLGDRTSHLDVYAGVRWYDLDIKATLNGDLLRDHTLSGGARWADGVVGARWAAIFPNNWETYVQGDLGGGGSEFSWQAIAAVGYKFKWGSVIGGWRYLHIDYDDGPYKLDAALTGPLLGVNFKF